jgi:hypothetical protein
LISFLKIKKEFDQQVHVFFTEKWQGDPTESEEMKPKWHLNSGLPFDQMWIDDPHWLPRVLAGEEIKAKFVFDESGSRIISQRVETL